MREPKNTKLLKATARERLLGRMGTLLAATVLYQIIQFFITEFVSAIVSPTNTITLVIYFVSAFLLELFFGVFVSGFAYLYLNVIYAQSISVADIFYGFRQNSDKALIIQIPFAIASTLLSVALSVGYYLMRIKAPGEQISFAVAFAVLGFILLIYLKLNFAMSFFLLHDFPERSAFDLLKTSEKVMRGYRFRLFKLYLSYIPLFLLGIITFFVPLLWIKVYKETAFAAFYQDRMAIAATAKNN
ncbi:MAG: DUF975 family protein [Butyrivibrio sp.]|nr:DUF975 family protein [Butyrivibrio sp.]